MKLTELADSLKTSIVVYPCNKEYEDPNKKFCCYLAGVQIMGLVLKPVWGIGETPEAAQKNYVERVRGEWLVKNHYCPAERIEFQAPETLTV